MHRVRLHLLALAATAVAVASSQPAGLFVVLGLDDAASLVSRDAAATLTVFLMPMAPRPVVDGLFPVVDVAVNDQAVPLAAPFTVTGPGPHVLEMTAVSPAAGTVHTERRVFSLPGPVLLADVDRPPNVTAPMTGAGVAACEDGATEPARHAVVLWSQASLDAVSAAAALVDAHPAVVLQDVWVVAPLNGLATLHPYDLAGWWHRPHHNARDHPDTRDADLRDPPRPDGRGRHVHLPGDPGRPWRAFNPLESREHGALRMDGETPTPNSVHVNGSFANDWFDAFFEGAAVGGVKAAGRRPFVLFVVSAAQPCDSSGGTHENSAMVQLRKQLTRVVQPDGGVFVSTSATHGAAALEFILGRFADGLVR